MRPEELTDTALRELLKAANSEAEHVLDPAAKPKAVAKRKALQAEADKRFKKSSWFNRAMTAIVGKILGLSRKDTAEQKHRNV
jgi:hypothetical protein